MLLMRIALWKNTKQQLQTKLDAVTTSLESAEKRLNKNIENDMKGMGS